MKKCCEYICGFQYKLRMIGIVVDGPDFIFGNKNYVLCNTTIPDYKLKKKSQSISYNIVGCM